jgi:hypothetical protein
LLVVLAAGCGSDKKQPVSGPPSPCEILAETTAEATVVKKAYDAGELGTAKQLAKHFLEPRSAYLNPDGTLKPFSQLNTDARIDFESWLHGNLDTEQSSLGDRIRAAQARVRSSSIATGKPCKQVILDQ